MDFSIVYVINKFSTNTLGHQCTKHDVITRGDDVGCVATLTMIVHLHNEDGVHQTQAQ